jgi:hypothetical protein
VPRVRRACARPRVLRAVILIPHAAALALALTAAPAPPSPSALPAPPAAVVELNAVARSAGTRRPEALRLARVLLARTWPAQVLKVRVDGAGSHAVAGLVLSGVKFHAPLDAAGFLSEVAALVRLTLDSSTVEEVDVWATVPVSVGKGAVVAGDFAQPTTRIVFSATVRRADAAGGVEALLRRGDVVFWDAPWKASLVR